jgi:hypothetical protein
MPSATRCVNQADRVKTRVPVVIAEFVGIAGSSDDDEGAVTPTWRKNHSSVR